MNVKLILFKGKTHRDGTHPIMLQYYINGRTKRKSIGHCLPENWDHKNQRLKTKVTNASVINHYLTEQYADAERLMFGVKMGSINTDQVFNTKVELTVAGAFDLELERYKSGNMAATYRRILSNKTTLSTMVDLTTPLSKIELKWFQALASALHLKSHSGGTDAKIIKTVRGIIARHHSGQLPENVKAFRIASTKTTKQKLNGDELAAVENLNYEPDTALAVVRDIFLLQVYLRGIRIGDILQARCRAFKDGRFNYQADKTGKEFSVALIDKARVIVDRYKSDSGYLFPLFQWVYDEKLKAFDNELNRIAERSSCTSFVNKHLKQVAVDAGIKKPLSTHIARHTFARMAIDKINNPMITMDLLGHTSLSVHQKYLNDLRKDEVLDKAADEVFG